MLYKCRNCTFVHYLSKSALIEGKIRKMEVSLLLFFLYPFACLQISKAKNREHFLDVSWGITFNICFKVIFYLDRNESIKMCSSEVFFIHSHTRIYISLEHITK